METWTHVGTIESSRGAPIHLAAFDPAEELLWSASQAGMVYSHLMPTAEPYSAFRAEEQMPVVALLPHPFGVITLNHDRVQGFDGQLSKQCALAYDGPAYKGLAASTWTRGEWDFAQAHLRILSGLYGVLRPFDTIRPYRLDMGTKLATEGHADLYSYWGTDIAAQLVAGDATVGCRAREQHEAAPCWAVGRAAAAMIGVT